MTDFIAALAIAFGVVFIAELGDKTQLLALGFGARYSLRTVAIGLTLGYAAANLVATVVGGVLGAALPERPIQIVGGLLFLGFISSVAVAIAVAEMGDKTQIATATLASQSAPLPATSSAIAFPRGHRT